MFEQRLVSQNLTGCFRVAFGSLSGRFRVPFKRHFCSLSLIFKGIENDEVQNTWKSTYIGVKKTSVRTKVSKTKPYGVLSGRFRVAFGPLSGTFQTAFLLSILYLSSDRERRDSKHPEKYIYRGKKNDEKKCYRYFQSVA